MLCSLVNQMIVIQACVTVAICAASISAILYAFAAFMDQQAHFFHAMASRASRRLYNA